jgi:aminocarboxymuconate-semialdehyde decarboxylase
MGADHVVVGTDYPFDMGHYDPLGQIDDVTSLSDSDRELIRGGTAARLLKLED